MTDNGQEYIPVETVASILRVSVRHASRFADRVRTERAGKRILFHRGDVEELAREIGADNKPLVPPLVELVPAGEMLASFEQQQQQLVALSHEVGRLQGIVEGQKALVEGYQQMQERVRDLEAEIDRLRGALSEAERKGIEEALDRERERVRQLELQVQPRRKWWWRRFLDK